MTCKAKKGNEDQCHKTHRHQLIVPLAASRPDRGASTAAHGPLGPSTCSLRSAQTRSRPGAWPSARARCPPSSSGRQGGESCENGRFLRGEDGRRGTRDEGRGVKTRHRVKTNGKGAERHSAFFSYFFARDFSRAVHSFEKDGQTQVRLPVARMNAQR